MKAESNIRPALPFEILELDNGEVEVLFYENIEIIPPESEDDAEKYSYDYYRIIIRNRENLQATINANYEEWIAMAKEKEIRETLHAPTDGDRLSALEDTINFILGL